MEEKHDVVSIVPAKEGPNPTQPSLTAAALGTPLSPHAGSPSGAHFSVRPPEPEPDTGALCFDQGLSRLEGDASRCENPNFNIIQLTCLLSIEDFERLRGNIRRTFVEA